MNHKTFRTVLIAVIFIGMIFFPILNEQFGFVEDVPSKENRALVEKPKFDIKLLDPYPGKYDAYYKDHFSLRFSWVEFYSYVQFYWFHISPIPEQALVGKDDWFFFAGNEQDSYLGTHRLTELELDSLNREFEYRRDFLAKQGTQFYLLIAPVKNNIYTEYQPSTAYPLYPDCWGEQVLKYVNAHSTVKTINVYDTLRAHRKENLLYYKRDNHWTPIGAFLAANAVLQRIHQDFPTVVPNRMEDYQFEKTNISVGNVAEMFGMKDLMIDTTVAFVPKGGFKAKDVPKVPYPPMPEFPYPWDYEHDMETPDTTKPKILVISDSFGHNMFPFIAEQFHRSVKIFDSWQYRLNADIVASEKPDIVLLMPMEANIRHILDNLAWLQPQ